MIQDVGNIELFELLETDPKSQCKACLSYWSEGIVCCTCGHLSKKVVYLLIETVSNRSVIVFSLDLFLNSRIRNQEGKTSERDRERETERERQRQRETEREKVRQRK